MRDYPSKIVYAIALHFLPERVLREIRPAIYQQVKGGYLDGESDLPGVAFSFLREAREVEKDCRVKGIEIVSCFCDNYPSELFEISDWPGAIFYQGKIANRPRVAIVGSRGASPYGLQTASQLAQQLTEAGVEVVSGLAFGIDRAAHEGAVRGAETTRNSAGIAVMACGLDEIYPAAHRDLSRRILDCGGAIVTEYPPGIKPRAHYFLRRNRIISGLCCAVVVVEAKERSGALATARHALEQGRDVFAVPGRIDSLQSAGTNRLIDQGAAPILGRHTVLDYLREQGAQLTITSRSQEEGAGCLKLENAVLRLIKQSPSNFDTLISMLDVRPEELMIILSALEVAELIYADPTGLFLARNTD